MLHDFMLSAATAAKERVNMRYQLHPSGLQHCCSILWPYLEEQRTLARKQKLAGALQVRLVTITVPPYLQNQDSRILINVLTEH